MDHFCFEQANHRLGQRIVIAVTHRSNTGFQSRVSQPFCVFDRQILAAPVAVMDQALCGPLLVKRLFKRVQDKLRLLRSGSPPTDELVSKRIAVLILRMMFKMEIAMKLFSALAVGLMLARPLHFLSITVGKQHLVKGEARKQG